MGFPTRTTICRTSTRTRRHSLSLAGASCPRTPRSRSTLLQHVDVPYYYPDVCAEAYKDRTNYTGVLITGQMLCAGHEGGGTGACFGDSGGPLSFDYSGKEYVVGVVSWGIGCGQPNLPSVYAKVSSAMWWIRTRGVLKNNLAEKRCPRPWWG